MNTDKDDSVRQQQLLEQQYEKIPVNCNNVLGVGGHVSGDGIEDLQQ